MPSIGNYSLPYPAANPPPRPPAVQPAANDVTIKGPAGPNLEIIGVEGVGPENPAATYGVEGQGTGSITLTGINVPIGGQLHVRLKSSGPTLPAVTLTWTFNGVAVPNVTVPPVNHAAAPPVEGGGQGESAALLVLEGLETALRDVRERLTRVTPPVG